MGVTESYGEDPCKFAIWTHRSPSEIYVLKTETPEDKVKWISTLKQLLEHLKQFANGKITSHLKCAKQYWNYRVFNVNFCSWIGEGYSH